MWFSVWFDACFSPEEETESKKWRMYLGIKLNSGVKTHSFRILRNRCIFSSYKSCPWAAALPAGSELLCLGQEGDRDGPVAFTEPLE